MIIGQLVPRRRHIAAATILLVPITAATIGANAAANGSPVHGSAVLGVPARDGRERRAGTCRAVAR